MKTLIILFSALYCVFLVETLPASVQPTPVDEGRAIAECLERYGGVTPENAERLQRYKEWSAAYEEIPCFTSCYLAKAFDVYNESSGFHEENVVKQFGRTLFEACKGRMNSLDEDTCRRAYSGFHCLVSLENDPFVYIEGLQKLDSEAKTAMKECLHRFDRYEWARLPDYADLPVREPIPCFTKCFVDRLQLFDERTKQWNAASMRSKLGINGEPGKAPRCKAWGRRRSRNVCASMYQEITCFIRA